MRAESDTAALVEVWRMREDIARHQADGAGTGGFGTEAVVGRLNLREFVLGL